MKSILYTISFFILMTFACQSQMPATYILSSPLKIDSSLFTSIRTNLNYENIVTVDQYFGGLKPRIPIAKVYSFDKKEKSLWRTEGMLLVNHSLVVKINDSLILIDSEDQFQSIFAPIEDEQEAISYVACLTRTYPQYNIERKFRYRCFVKEFPSTFAKKVSDGYEVILHDKEIFGCGPHPCFYKVYHVTTSGKIDLLKNVKMFEDPEEDNLCVD